MFKFLFPPGLNCTKSGLFTIEIHRIFIENLSISTNRENWNVSDFLSAVLFFVFSVCLFIIFFTLFDAFLGTVFTRIIAAALIKFFAPQVRRLFEGGAYLKRNLVFYLNDIYSICTKKNYSNRSVFSLSPFTSFSTFQWCPNSTQILLSPWHNNPFVEKTHVSAVLDFLCSVF